MSLLQLFTATDAAPYAWSLMLAGGTAVSYTHLTLPTSDLV